MRTYYRIVLTETNEILPWYYKSWKKADDYIYNYLWRLNVKAHIIEEKE